MNPNNDFIRGEIDKIRDRNRELRDATCGAKREIAPPVVSKPLTIATCVAIGIGMAVGATSSKGSNTSHAADVVTTATPTETPAPTGK